MSDVSVNATTWIQCYLTPLFTAAKPRSADADAATADETAFQDAFARTFAPTCEVRHNHAIQPLEALREDLVARRAMTTHVSPIVWNGDLMSTNDDNMDEPAVVAGALVITRSLPFRIRVTPAQRQMHLYFSARIERDGDRRHITSFYYTSVDKAPPIHFAVPRAAQEGGRSDGQ